MDWKLIITKVDNGYILNMPSEEEGVSITQVVEELDEYEDEPHYELLMMQEVLLKVQDMFGVYNSKHNSHRLNIELVKQ